MPCHVMSCFAFSWLATPRSALEANQERLNSGDRHSNSRSWWVKITTKQPDCLYYFGSFATRREAKENCFGYVEDIAAEKAFGITVEIIYITQPEVLTVFKED